MNTSTINSELLERLDGLGGVSALELSSNLEKIGKLLRARGWKMAATESCTGGLLSALITSVPGSSDYFAGSVVTYSNECKIKLAHVRPETLAKFGAVSVEAASEMANGGLMCCGHSRDLMPEVSVAITGIAGPTGGEESGKKVGTVCFAWQFATKLRVGFVPVTATQNFVGSRNAIQFQAVAFALSELVRLLAASKAKNI